MSEKVSSIDRRQFLSALGIGAAAAVGGGVLASCSPAPAGGTGGGNTAGNDVSIDESRVPTSAGTQNTDWLGSAPTVGDADCASTETADVVVVGAGVAGISAARAAAESGANVIVVEQTAAPVIRGLVFGALDSTYQKSLGAVYDNNEVVNEIMRAMGNRPNQRLWKKWADESGATFDWFVEALDESDKYFLEFWPNPSKYDNSKELRKQYCTGIEFVDWVGAVTKHYEKSVSAGASYAFNMKAVSFAQDSAGAVVGVYAQAADGTYTKYEATKGVVLCTGDYGHNVDMVRELCPEFYWNTNGAGTMIETSNGDGHKMALWAGGFMEPAPHAHMDHTFADMMGIGNTTALSLNAKGERYANEDCDGQSLTNQIVRQPGKVAYQIFDSTWESMLDNQPISHGMPSEPNTSSVDRVKESLKGAIDKPSDFLAGFNTLDELFEYLKLPVDVAKASVEHYNELCAAGKDSDFGKRADRMYPVSTPPFYGASSLIATGVMTAGIMVDHNLKVLKEDFEPIGNLWAAGNVAGGRFANDYPVYPVVASSHGTAITFGRSCGLQAAGAAGA
jgi:succinate dehydrogenase/fumarate reductase flavoprotein subunit